MTQSTTGGALYWEAGIDPQALYNEVAKINERLKSMADNTEKEGKRMDDVFKTLGGALAGYLSVSALAGFGQQVIKVRGEFQQLGIAFETMLGSKTKADAMMAEMIQFAQKTPFTLTDVASNAKQLMAMGVESENVLSTLKSLGDVAAGVSVPLERIAINYGQVLTLGKLQGRELRDFAMAGIPLLDELAKNLNKTKNEVSEMVSAGTIGFKEVERAFQTMAGEGGKFANLMEKQNTSVTGQISNLQDKISVMLNDIGKSNEGLIYSGIKGASEFVAHYQEVIDVLKVMVLTYGAYRTALIVNSLLIDGSIVKLGRYIVNLVTLATASRTAKDAQIALNFAMGATVNPWVAVATAVGLLTAALIVYSKKARTSEEVTESLNNAISGLGKGTKDIDKLVEKYDSLQANQGRTVEQNKELTDTMNAISTAVNGSATAFDKYGNALGINKDKVKEYSEGIKNAFKTTIEADVKAKEAEASLLQKKIDGLLNISQGGKVKETIVTGSNGMYGQSNTQTITRDATKEEVEKAAREILTLNKSIGTINEEIKAGKDNLKGIITETATTASKEAETVAQAIERIDKSIAELEEKRKKLKTTDTKGFAAFTKQIEDLEKEKKKYEGKDDADRKKEDKALEERNKIIEDLNQKHLSNLEEFANFEAGISASRIAAMDDSLDKELKQNQLAFETREKEIKREKEQTLKLLNKEKGTKLGDAGFVTELTGAEKSDFDQKNANNLKAQQEADLKSRKNWAEKAKTIWDEITTSALSGYEKEIQANKEKYDKMAKDAKKYNDPKLTEAIEKERAKAVEKINNDHAMTMLEYSEQLEYKKNEVKSEGFDRDAKLEALNFQTWVDHQKRRLAILKASTSAEDQAQASVIEADIQAGETSYNLNTEKKIRQDIVMGAQQLVDLAGQYNTELGRSMAAILSIGTTLDTVITKGETMSKGDAINMAVSGLSGLVNLVAGSYAERKRISDEYYKSTLKQQLEYNILLNDQLRLNSEINGSLFLKDYAGTLVDSTKAYNDAQQKFAEQFKKFQDAQAIIGQKNVVSGTNVLAGVGSGAALGAGIGTLIGGPVIGTAIGALVGGIAGLFAKKSKDIVAPLLETYKDLISPAGEFNIELAKSLVDTGKLTDTTNDVIKNLIQWKEKAEAAREQLKGVISDLSGSMGDDIKNALVQAFKEGTDSAVAFGDSVNKVLENIMTNMLFNKVFAGAFKKLEEGMTQSYEDGGDKTWIDDLKVFLEQKKTLTEQFNAELQAGQDFAKTQGFDILQKTETVGNSKSLSNQIQRTITEVTGQELAGLIRTQTEDARKTRDYTMQAVTHLAMIEANTGRTADNTEELTPIKATLKSIDIAVNKTASRL